MERFVSVAAPEAIWGILADVEHWSAWTPTVSGIVALSDGGLKTGARYRVTQPKLRPAVYEVTECVANEAFTWVQRFPGGEMIADHRLKRVEGGTEVELSFATRGLVGWLVGLVYSKLIRDYVATEARSLKRRSDGMV
ncbi:MAG TPA: SRPBCC family protein [Bryobacteraceae bacterium]|nr:SRPBCC family protein [Bryobacteraceae bacterium]